MSKYATKKSSELRQGDVVLTSGLRVLLDREITQYPHEPHDGLTDGTVYACRGVVLNWADLRKSDPWLYNFVNADLRDDDDVEGLDGHFRRWTIQGNDLARWYVEESDADIARRLAAQVDEYGFATEEYGS